MSKGKGYLDLTAEARMLYRAQPTAYNARALQVAVRLDALDWQPIETAPRDVQVLLFCPEDSIYIGEVWTDYTSEDEKPYCMVLEIGEVFPTHWMPRPQPPKE